MGGTFAETLSEYQAASRIRRRIDEELTTDVEVLQEQHPQLLEELREVVCSHPSEPAEDTNA